jgi:hypothetical protein
LSCRPHRPFFSRNETAVYERLAQVKPAALLQIRSQFSDNPLENAAPAPLLEAALTLCLVSIVLSFAVLLLGEAVNRNLARR